MASSSRPHPYNVRERHPKTTRGPYAAPLITPLTRYPKSEERSDDTNMVLTGTPAGIFLELVDVKPFAYIRGETPKRNYVPAGDRAFPEFNDIETQYEIHTQLEFNKFRVLDAVLLRVYYLGIMTNAFIADMNPLVFINDCASRGWVGSRISTFITFMCDRNNVRGYYMHEQLIMPWSNIVIPRIQKLCDGMVPGFDSTILPYTVPSADCKTLWSLGYDRNAVKYVARNCFYASHRMASYFTDSPPTSEEWVANTLDMYPSVTGTACVGKTSILETIAAAAQRELDDIGLEMKHKVIVDKISNRGQYAGKDNSMEYAMLYQLAQLGINVSKPCVIDRSVMDNLLWRYIMAFMDDNVEDDVQIDRFVTAFGKVMTPMMLAGIKSIPICFILEGDIRANRDRMIARNSGGDAVRATIKNYVAAQNMVYGTLAYLIKAPTFVRNAPNGPMDEVIAENIINYCTHKIVDVATKHPVSKIDKLAADLNLDPDALVEMSRVEPAMVGLDMSFARECGILK